MALKAELNKGKPPKRITSPAGVDYHLERVMTALCSTIKKTVPLTNPSPYTNQWWTKTLSKLRKVHKRLGRAHYTHQHLPDHPVHAQYRKAWNHYMESIQRAKNDHWTEWLESIDAKTICLVWYHSTICKNSLVN